MSREDLRRVELALESARLEAIEQRVRGEIEAEAVRLKNAERARGGGRAAVGSSVRPADDLVSSQSNGAGASALAALAALSALAAAQRTGAHTDAASAAAAFGCHITASATNSPQSQRQQHLASQERLPSSPSGSAASIQQLLINRRHPSASGSGGSASLDWDSATVGATGPSKSLRSDATIVSTSWLHQLPVEAAAAEQSSPPPPSVSTISTGPLSISAPSASYQLADFTVSPASFASAIALTSPPRNFFPASSPVQLGGGSGAAKVRANEHEVLGRARAGGSGSANSNIYSGEAPAAAGYDSTVTFLNPLSVAVRSDDETTDIKGADLATTETTAAVPAAAIAGASSVRVRVASVVRAVVSVSQKAISCRRKP